MSFTLTTKKAELSRVTTKAELKAQSGPMAAFALDGLSKVLQSRRYVRIGGVTGKDLVRHRYTNNF